MAKQCFICKCSDVNDIELGEILDYKNLHFHYFCLLLTTNLCQNGEDNEGLLGFMIDDIKSCEISFRKKICYICHKPSANIECQHRKCTKRFHTGCGLNRCLNTFTGSFDSFCGKHHNLYDNQFHENNESCLICYDDMDKYSPITSIKPVCCKSGWLHKTCVAKYAKNAGYFCKCPLCNNESEFRNFIATRGVFIPDSDAAWEREPNAYRELLERPSACQAVNCVWGDRYKRNNGCRMKLCSACGSYIAHIKCLQAVGYANTKDYVCAICSITTGDHANNATNMNETTEGCATSSTVETFEISDSEDEVQNQVVWRRGGRLKRDDKSCANKDSLIKTRMENSLLSEHGDSSLNNSRLLRSGRKIGDNNNMVYSLRPNRSSSQISYIDLSTSDVDGSDCESSIVFRRRKRNSREEFTVANADDDNGIGPRVKRHRRRLSSLTVDSSTPQKMICTSNRILNDISNDPDGTNTANLSSPEDINKNNVKDFFALLSTSSKGSLTKPANLNRRRLIIEIEYNKKELTNDKVRNEPSSGFL